MNPSLGRAGLMIDHGNMRVKWLYPERLDTADEVARQVGRALTDTQAQALLTESRSRFTGKVFVPRGMQIPSFQIGNMTIAKEARICISPAHMDLVFIGANTPNRHDPETFTKEVALATEVARVAQHRQTTCTARCERLTHVSAPDASDLIEMYRACFTSYPVTLDEKLVRDAATNSIFFVARNGDGKIVASAIGESLTVCGVTLLEVSEEAAHPDFRIPGAASECARRVIAEAKRSLNHPVVAFWEARMWRKVLEMGPRVGLTCFGGILHQHCRISAPKAFTSVPNSSEFGSLAVFYAQ